MTSRPPNLMDPELEPSDEQLAELTEEALRDVLAEAKAAGFKVILPGDLRVPVDDGSPNQMDKDLVPSK